MWTQENLRKHRTVLSRKKRGYPTDVSDVAQEMLDVLLAAETSRPDHSLLAEFILRQKTPVILNE